jgi:hypothetical protein
MDAKFNAKKVDRAKLYSNIKDDDESELEEESGEDIEESMEEGMEDLEDDMAEESDEASNQRIEDDESSELSDHVGVKVSALDEQQKRNYEVLQQMKK